MKTLNQTIGLKKKQLGKLNEKIAKYYKQLDKVGKQVDKLGKRLDKGNLEIGHLQGDRDAIKREIEQLEFNKLNP